MRLLGAAHVRNADRCRGAQFRRVGGRRRQVVHRGDYRARDGEAQPLREAIRTLDNSTRNLEQRVTIRGSGSDRDADDLGKIEGWVRRYVDGSGEHRAMIARAGRGPACAVGMYMARTQRAESKKPDREIGLSA